MADHDDVTEDQRGPETEDEYWEVIQMLGGLQHSMRHSHDYSEGMSKAIFSNQKSLEDVVLEMCLRFGVIHPHQPELTPDGTRDYWEWYRGTRAKILGGEYDGTVCSCCPYASDRDHHIEMNGGELPCSLFGGFHRLNVETASVRCDLAEHNRSWAESRGHADRPSSHEDLLQMILDIHGPEAWDRMKKRLGMDDLAQTRREVTIVVDRDLDHIGPLGRPVRSCVMDVSGGFKDPSVVHSERGIECLRAPWNVIEALFDRQVRYYKKKVNDRGTFTHDGCVYVFATYRLSQDEGIMVAIDEPYTPPEYDDEGQPITDPPDHRLWRYGLFRDGNVSTFLRFIDGDEEEGQDLISTAYFMDREGAHPFFTDDVMGALFTQTAGTRPRDWNDRIS